MNNEQKWRQLVALLCAEGVRGSADAPDCAARPGGVAPARRPSQVHGQGWEDEHRVHRTHLAAAPQKARVKGDRSPRHKSSDGRRSAAAPVGTRVEVSGVLRYRLPFNHL